MNKRYPFDSLLTDNVWMRAYALLCRLSFGPKLAIAALLWMLGIAMFLWVTR